MVCDYLNNDGNRKTASSAVLDDIELRHDYESLMSSRTAKILYKSSIRCRMFGGMKQMRLLIRSNIVTMMRKNSLSGVKKQDMDRFRKTGAESFRTLIEYVTDMITDTR